MIAGREIPRLVKLLESRHVSLFHACQFTDFQAYLDLGGIPSRAFLEKNRLSFTAFETDEVDHSNGVWDKVFTNLSDFGAAFAKGRRCVPNPYGPIVLQIKPAALLEAEDVAVCLRSAGARDFDRQQEALPDTAAVDQIFYYPSRADFPHSAYVKFSELLREIDPRAVNPEVSCTFARGFIPISDVIVAWVDPYEIEGRPLVDWVRESLNGAGFPVWQRRCCSERHPLYEALLAALYPSPMSLPDITGSAQVCPCLSTWAGEILRANLEYQYCRYARYLNEGTLRPLYDG